MTAPNVFLANLESRYSTALATMDTAQLHFLQASLDYEQAKDALEDAEALAVLSGGGSNETARKAAARVATQAERAALQEARAKQKWAEYDYRQAERRLAFARDLFQTYGTYSDPNR